MGEDTQVGLPHVSYTWAFAVLRQLGKDNAPVRKLHAQDDLVMQVTTADSLTRFTLAVVASRLTHYILSLIL